MNVLEGMKGVIVLDNKLLQLTEDKRKMLRQVGPDCAGSRVKEECELKR